jgi:O-antigen/teichoic acid export membrane protein
MLNVVYFRADMQILYVLSGCGADRANHGCAPVGQYGAAYRWLDILVTVFVASVNAATLPAFNRVVAESRSALARMLRAACTLMLVFGVPVALFGTFYATDALRVWGRNYVVAAPALAILVWAFPLFLLEGMLFNALYAVRRQKVVTVAFAVTLVFNIGLNIILIPRYSYLASSALTVASEALNGLIVLVAVTQILGPLGLRVPVLRMAGIAAVTAIALWLLRNYSIFVGLPIGLVVLVIGLRMGRVIGPSEREILSRVPLAGRYAGWL